ncbi:MAG TPA: hypothetical protein VM581_02905 [Magnetospirillaceae bacterium]|nr:hypothetical protein [Magnetospirillaceae bacterium]
MDALGTNPEPRAAFDKVNSTGNLESLVIRERSAFRLDELQNLSSPNTRLAKENYELDIETMYELALSMSHGDDLARRALFESFMPTVVQIARGAWHRQGRKAELDDLVQTGFTELWAGLERVAQLIQKDEISPEGIGGLLTSSVRGGVNGEISSLLRVKLNSKDVVELAEFRRRLKSQQRVGNRVDVQAIADDMGINVHRAMGWYTLCWKYAFYSIDSQEEQADAERVLFQLRGELGNVESQENPELRNVVERSLELLTPPQALAVARYHGFSFYSTSLDEKNPLDGAAMIHSEVGAFLGMTESGAKTFYHEGVQILKNVIPDMTKGTFDYAMWLTQYPRRRGAQVFLATIDVPVPDLTHSLSDIRTKASDLVIYSDLAPIDKDILIHGFGLETGRSKDWIEIASLVGMPHKQGVSWHAKRSIGILKEAFAYFNKRDSDSGDVTNNS